MLALSVALLLASPGARAAGEVANDDDLARLSLEELGNIRITSVSKRPERLADAAASVYVITREDIRRSGFASLPEVLRLAPNLQVAQISGSGYAISARGFNGSNNSAPNKLLVLVDGRSVYTPLFSGVFWDAQIVPLADVERIEVISGPGGTLWGVNAVNGVINIITRSAADTTGALVHLSGGDRQSDGLLRVGGALGENASWRVYAMAKDRKHGWTEAGMPIDDAVNKAQVGFRLDGGADANRWLLSGAVYDGREGQPEPGQISVAGTPFQLGDVDFSGAHLLGRWEHEMPDGSSISLQGYLDRSERTVPPTFAETLDIVDVQFQHLLRPLGAHSIAWGANYRRSRDDVTNSVLFAFLPARLEQTWASLFVQDEARLGQDLTLTLGARLERNDYTGNEFLPNIRLAWNPAHNHLLWAAASRAARAPSRLDVDAHIPGIPPFLLDRSPDPRSEIAEVVELGYRGQPSARVSLSATVFHARYDRLHTLEIAPSGTYLIFGNLMEGSTRGFEAWGQFEVTAGWRLGAGFTALDENLRLKPGSVDVEGPLAAGTNPSSTWQLRSSWSVGTAVDLDLGVRHVGRLERDDVPSYTAVDARVAARLHPGLELSLVGRNLFGRHAEYGALETRLEIEPSVYLALTWDY